MNRNDIKNFVVNQLEAIVEKAVNKLEDWDLETHAENILLNLESMNFQNACSVKNAHIQNNKLNKQKKYQNQKKQIRQLQKALKAAYDAYLVQNNHYFKLLNERKK